MASCQRAEGYGHVLGKMSKAFKRFTVLYKNDVLLDKYTSD